MSVKAVEAGGAVVRLRADDKGVKQVLSRLGGQLQGLTTLVKTLGVGMMASGAAMIAPIAAITKTFADSGDAIMNMASRTGMTTEAISELMHVCESTNVPVTTLEGAIRKMQDTVTSASRGSKDANTALGRFGQTASALDGMSPDEQLKAFANGLRKIENPAERTAALLDVFGKSGTALIPILAEGSDGIASMMDEARKLGRTLGAEGAAKAARLDAALDTLGSATKGISKAIGEAFAPTMSTAVELINKAIVATTSFINANKNIVVAVAAVGAALGVTGAALGTIAGMALTVWGTFLGLKAAVAGIASAVGFVFTPIGAVVAAVVTVVGLATAAFFTLANPIKALAPLFKTVSLAARDITTALLSGDFKGAANKVMTAVKAIFLGGVKAVLDMVHSTMTNIPKVIVRASNAILGAIGMVTGKVPSAFQSMVPPIQVALSAIWQVGKDVFTQLPGIAGYAVGRAVRAIVDGFVKVHLWLGRMLENIGKGLLEAFSNFAPRLLQALFSGDVSGVAKDFGLALQKALAVPVLAGSMAGSGFGAGLTKGEAPEFSLSNDSKAAMQQLSTEIGKASGKLGTSIGQTAGQPGKQTFDDIAADPAKAKKAKEVTVDDTTLQKYQKRLSELTDAHKKGKLTAEQFATGVQQLKQDVLGISQGPLEQLKERVIVLNAAVKNGTISWSEWQQGIKAAKSELLGIEPSQVEQFSTRLKVLHQALSSGAIDSQTWRDQVKKAREDIFGLEASPLQEFTVSMANRN